MKTLILIMVFPVLALAWELPPSLELVSINGDYVTVRDTRTGIMDCIVGRVPNPSKTEKKPDIYFCSESRLISYNI